VVFTYGDTVYNPSGETMQDHLEFHESIHIKQQAETGRDEWWDRYLADEEFRLEQELQAYRKQYQYVLRMYGRQAAAHLLGEIAGDLSSSMYGNILTFNQAKKEIKK
jgi:hypothetical protein